ncbi:hypothetical protein MASR2M15_13520 [Anaerolineales bacterium]
MKTERDLRREKKQKRNKVILPVMGFILLLIFAVLAFFASEPVSETLIRSFPSLPNDPLVQVITGLAIFGVLLTFTALIYSFYASYAAKKERATDISLTVVTEKDLDKERKQKREEELKKRRQKKMAARMSNSDKK